MDEQNLVPLELQDDEGDLDDDTDQLCEILIIDLVIGDEEESSRRLVEAVAVGAARFHVRWLNRVYSGHYKVIAKMAQAYTRDATVKIERPEVF